MPNSFFISPREFPLKNRQIIADGTTAVFTPSVIERTQLSFELGLDTKSCQVKWSPDPSLQYGFGLNTPTGSTPSPTTGSLYWQFQRGGFDNGCLRIWRAFMPADGDADSLGLAQLFIGRIADVIVHSDQIEITANSFSEIFDQQVPRFLIEAGQRSNQVSSLSVEDNAMGINLGNGDTVASPINSANTVAFVADQPSAGFLFADHSLAGCYAYIAGCALLEIADIWNDGVKNYVTFYKGVGTIKGIGLTQQIKLVGSLPANATSVPIGNAYALLPGFQYLPRPEDQF